MAKIEFPEDMDNVVVGFEPLPPDWYKVIIQQEPETMQGREYPYLRWVLTTQHEGQDRQLFHNTSLSPKALGMLKGLLEAAGIPYEGTSFDTNDALGQELMVKVVQREYEGKIMNDVKDVKPVE